jgi:hypothetical protein
MRILKRLLKLPSPVDLGWTEVNALTIEFFNDDPNCKTWEDYDRYIAEHYPVKNFLVNTLPRFVRRKIVNPVYVPLNEAYYWLVSHVIPSRRYHMLDLRQPYKEGDAVNLDCYRWGWCDVPEKMLYAMFNLLGEYLAEEPTDLRKWHTPEEIEADAGMKEQQHNLDESRAIHKWWTVERNVEMTAIQDMTMKWHDAREVRDPRAEEYWKQLKDMQAWFEEREDDMVGRLMAIRRSLWK